ncbi:MAG: transposase [Sedimentibacter sp.]
MARHARKISSTGIYHIMLRGINKEQIFQKNYYKSKILKLLSEIKNEIHFSIIAYCIMDNHLHLLAKIGDDDLKNIMKKLNVKFALYYNRIEERYGYVFQDRFKSEVVEDEKYLVGVLRYIHNNPVKATLTDSIINYQWSSAKDYINDNTGLLDEHYMNEILNLFKNKDDFLNFHKSFDDNLYLDTKEEQSINVQSIIKNEIEQFMNKKGIIDQSRITLNMKEELAKKLIKRNLITNKEVASLCNLSYKRVLDIYKTLETSL